jgi:hypothetical protein
MFTLFSLDQANASFKTMYGSSKAKPANSRAADLDGREQADEGADGLAMDMPIADPVGSAQLFVGVG